MSDLTAVEWLPVQLQPIGAALMASWDRAAPALKTAYDWVAIRFLAAVDWAGAALQLASETLHPYLATALAALAPHWPEIVAAAVGTVVIVGLAMFRSLQRRRSLKMSLVEATLGRDPKTGWLELAIVMRNLQPRALLVHSIQVIDPPGTKICEHWQAWQPATAGVKFVAPELELTNTISIERTVLPYEPADYATFDGGLPRGSTKQNAGLSDDERSASPSDELIRRFYVRPPSAQRQQIALRARLICELQTRRGRRQELVFRRTLPFAAPGSAALRDGKPATPRVS
jgi:hypothetical protein